MQNSMALFIFSVLDRKHPFWANLVQKIKIVSLLLFYILKMVTLKEIREIFREMLQEHETKQEEMFTKHEKLVLDLISGHQALLQQKLDQLCDSLASVKKDAEELKENLSFTQNDIDQRFSNNE